MESTDKSTKSEPLGPKLLHKGGRAMDSIIDAFFAIDVDNREVISLQDLKFYCEQHNLEESFPETFLRRFDATESGTITLEQYCKAFGFIPKEVRDLRRRRTIHLFEQLMPPDLEIIYDDISPEIKVHIVRNFLEELREGGCKPNVDMERLDAAMQNMKAYLEELFGKTWHIIVSINQHLARFSYCPGFMFHFCLGRFAVLIWKTPQPS